MSLMMLAMRGRRRKTQTFYSNATWIAPATTSRVETVAGSGGAGTPGAPQQYGYGSTVVASAVNVVSGMGANQENPVWANLTDYAQMAKDWVINGSTSSSAPVQFNKRHFELHPDDIYGNGYPLSATYSLISIGFTTQSNVIPSSVYITRNYNAGWSGPMLDILRAQPNITYSATLNWQYAIPGTYAPATTGASTTAFGLTFAGGYGGVATPATQSAVTVTPGASYSIVVGSGGSVTITYY